MSRQTAPQLPPITTAAEGQSLIAHVAGVMDSLQQLVEQETDLARAGRIEAAVRLANSKSELARAYAANIGYIKANHAILVRTVPDALRSLQQRHEQFRSVLQLNMTVLATAHAVSEGIIRGVARELQQKTAPQTYGASGRSVPTPKTSHRPLALSRSL